MEVELKLFFPATAKTSVESHPLFSGGMQVGVPETLESTYFDSPDFSLRAAGIVVRTCVTQQGCLQKVRCAAQSVAAPSSRSEWEQPFDGRFDFSGIDVSEGRQLLEAHTSNLVPIFRTVLERQTRMFALHGDVCILLQLDSGHLQSGEIKAPISELRLELVDGSADDLHDLAIELASDLPLIPFGQSLSEQGYRQFRREPGRPLKAGKTPVHSGMSPAEAFNALGMDCLSCWQGNQHGALTADDPEFIHQLRVSLRRLGTLMRLFKPMLRRKFVETWSGTFKRVAATSGEVRDLDVMRETILLPMRDTAASAADAELLRRTIEACDRAKKAAGAICGKLMLNGVPQLVFARDLSRACGKGSKKSMEEFAAKRLAKIFQAVSERLAKAVRKPSPESAHRLRISLKHLRYSCEFFISLFDEAAMRRFSEHITELQDELGVFNDLHVARSRLDDWSKDDPDLLKVRKYLVAWSGDQLESKLEITLKRAEQIIGEHPPWVVKPCP